MVKVKLNVGERINLLDIFPKQGDYSTLRIIQDASMILAPSEEEHKKFGIVSQNVDGMNNYQWNEEGSKEIDIELGPRAFSLICEEFEKKDKAKQVNIHQLALYEKFVKSGD